LEVTVLKKEPSLLIAFALTAAGGLSEVLRTLTDSGWLAAVPVAATALAGILIRFNVVAPATIETIIGEARSGGEALTRIAGTVGATLPHRPSNGG
jgi:hypothetical protein